MQVPDYARGYDGFPGRIGRTISTSEPAWPSEPTAPAGSPNIVVISGRRPRLRRHRPVRQRDRHPAPRSAGRDAVMLHRLPHHAAVLADSGRAAHRAQPAQGGLRLPANADPGYPAYAFRCRTTHRRWPRSLRDRRLCDLRAGQVAPGRRPAACTTERTGLVAVPARLRPLLRQPGGLHHLHAPHRLVWDNSPYSVQEFPEGYYLTDDLTDRAIEMITTLRAADARKPFLLYLAHARCTARAGQGVDLADYAGVYDGGLGPTSARSGSGGRSRWACSRRARRCRPPTTSRAGRARRGTSPER